MDAPETSGAPMVHPVYLQNGELVQVNDHVYCSPSWTVREGTPYSIARVMEFLRPEGKIGPEGDSYHYSRVRLAWYYRPSDVSERAIADSRLLLAAIYSEVCDINQIRAKCYVVHRDKIADLSGWKKRPDRFYFTRLFDPYIKKEFEIIQSTEVRNLPDHIRQNLIDRYEYIVTEKEEIPILLDNVRACKSCSKWCPNADSVQCDRCKGYFHMECVQPPLSAKPSRGYGWSCAPCSRVHEEEVDTLGNRHASPNGKVKTNGGPITRGRGRPRKDRNQISKEETVPIKYFQMWPFRYFGQYTVAEDTLDDEDLIFPTAPVRQGPKYQTTCPDLNSPPIDEERGGDNTIEIYGVFPILTEAEVAEMEAHKRSLSDDPKVYSSVDWLTEVIHRLSDAALNARSVSTVNMKNPMRAEAWKPQALSRWTDKEWSKDEIAAFEDAIHGHGAELRPVREEVVTRTMPEVVRFYGHWKNSKVGEENERIRSAPNTPTETQYKKYAEGAAAEGQTIGLPDDEKSVVSHPSSKAPSCGACRTRETKMWWKAPKGLATALLCDNCGTNYRKYADLNVRPQREDSVAASYRKEREKREGTPLSAPPAKRSKTSGSVQSTPPPAGPSVPQLKCRACNKNGPVGKVLQCKKCKTSVHAGACGVVVDPTDIESWLCEVCDNETSQETSLIPECVLCPREHSPSKGKLPGPSPDSFLRICKPTEGQLWAHVLCAVFIPEITFTDATKMKLVEGISAIGYHRWSQRCSLCQSTEGAIVKCTDCTREYHVSCAWTRGHKFGFEMQPVKNSRRDTTVITTFKGETGSMSAVISCKDHDHRRRDIYDICDTNEGGETALQVYCRAYKQADIVQSHALFRKARRLDQILNMQEAIPPPPVDVTIPPDDVECAKCHTQFSPIFHRSLENPSQWLCHTCHFSANQYMDVNVEINGNGAIETRQTSVSVI